MPSGFTYSLTLIRAIAALLFWLSPGPVALAQSNGLPPADTTSEDSVKRARIEIINTDVFEFNTTDSNQVRQFTGNVHFRHEGTDFHCNKAVQFMDTEIVIATGGIHIQKPDSFDIWSDYLVYYSRTKIAKFRGGVIFEDSTARLSTDSLDYNLDTDIGYFWGGGSLTTDSSVLTSETGTYYHRRREAVFNGKVHLANPEFDLYSDSMRYDTREQVAWFIALTRIESGEDVIVTNTGYYDTRTHQAKFGDGTEMVSGTTRIVADELIYDREAGYGEATGNVIWQDTAEQITIIANYAEYLDSIDYVLATGDPLLIDVNDEDTLYLSADTLITKKRPYFPAVTDVMAPDSLYTASDSYRVLPDNMRLQDSTAVADTLLIPDADPTDPVTVEIPTGDTTAGSARDSLLQAADSTNAKPLLPVATDSIRIFYAFNNTRMLNGRLSGDCDSLFFSQADSVFRMHGMPHMWVDTTQFSGDSMHMVLRNGGLDRILIYRNAMIIHENAVGVYDQTKGTLITGYFRDDALKRMVVEGNGESIYFIQDDSSAYLGGNKSLCSRMILYMKDTTDEVDRITFLTKPEATFTPMSMIQMGTYNLEGFHWLIERKPFTVYDIVRYLPLYEQYLLWRKEKGPAEPGGDRFIDDPPETLPPDTETEDAEELPSNIEVEGAD